MLILIKKELSTLAPGLPEFATAAFRNIEVPAQKVDGKYHVLKVDALEKIKQRKHDFVHAATYIAGKEDIGPIIVVLEDECIEKSN